MSGTDIASGASCLRACYAMSDTDSVYGAMHILHTWCAMPGTDALYGSTRIPTAFRYPIRHQQPTNAGTDVLYDPTSSDTTSNRIVLSSRNSVVAWDMQSQ
eukprot:3931875-Rhodomonas_salina.6